MLNCQEPTAQGEVPGCERRLSFLPLVPVVVPLGREALDGAHLHVQHPLGLHGDPVLLKGVRDGAVHCSPKQAR